MSHRRHPAGAPASAGGRFAPETAPHAAAALDDAPTFEQDIAAITAAARAAAPRARWIDIGVSEQADGSYLVGPVIGLDRKTNDVAMGTAQRAIADRIRQTLERHGIVAPLAAVDHHPDGTVRTLNLHIPEAP